MPGASRRGTVPRRGIQEARVRVAGQPGQVAGSRPGEKIKAGIFTRYYPGARSSAARSHTQGVLGTGRVRLTIRQRSVVLCVPVSTVVVASGLLHLLRRLVAELSVGLGRPDGSIRGVSLQRNRDQRRQVDVGETVHLPIMDAAENTSRVLFSDHVSRGGSLLDYRFIVRRPGAFESDRRADGGQTSAELLLRSDASASREGYGASPWHRIRRIGHAYPRRIWPQPSERVFLWRQKRQHHAPHAHSSVDNNQFERAAACRMAVRASGGRVGACTPAA